MTIQNYQLAVGWDNEAGLTNIESLTPANSTTFRVLGTNVHYFVQSLGLYDVPYIQTPGGRSQNGFAKLIWRMRVASAIALTDLRDTYGQNSAQVGKVTIKTRLEDDSAYVNKNAVLFVPYPNVATVDKGAAFFASEEGIELMLNIVGDPS